MTRKVRSLAPAALLALILGIGALPAGAQAVGTPFVGSTPHRMGRR